MKNFDNYKKYACDFETTVYDGQESTEVWSSAICEVGCEDADSVLVLHSIDETFNWCMNLNESAIMYYHNLKFDGEFWVSYLLNHPCMKLAYKAPDTGDYSLKEARDLQPWEWKPTISDMGMWYQIVLQFPKHTIYIRDSLKLMPFSLSALAQAFKTKHQKLDMEYTGKRYAGCAISPDEMAYIKNDVLVLAEALHYMFTEGHKKLTIGSCCMEEFKNTQMKESYNDMFPDLSQIETDEPYVFMGENMDAYIRRSYHGGWCYVNPVKAGRVIHGGCTFDVNSLYPSVMHSESGNYYPIGKPTQFYGKIPENVYRNNLFYFVTVRCRFDVKEGCLPFIQIKGNPYYLGTECLTTSQSRFNTEYDEYGKPLCNTVELVLSKPEHELFMQHYNVYDYEEVCGCYFSTDIGLFDTYINKYRQIKMESKGAKRTIAKLFLNNLYGKFAMSKDATYKVPYTDGGVVKYHVVPSNADRIGYIAIGSAITAYARCFTIKAAQQNYNHFCYSDTDSIHLDIEPEYVQGVPEHPTAFCRWKCESCWDTGLFLRQKTYIEHIVQEDHEDVEPYYNVKCAGMNKRCKDLFIQSMTQSDEERREHARLWWDGKGTPVDRFLSVNRTITDFKTGLKIPAKLMPTRIAGGVVLRNTTFEIR